MTMQLFTPKQYLMIDVANGFGLDKKNWDVRLDWFAQHEPMLESMQHMAKEPAQFFASVQAYRDMQQGKPIGHLISLDATASGMQILSCLAGCPQSALQCNVLDSGKRENAYANNFEELAKLVEAHGGTRGMVDPDDAKQALMTALYSSKAVPRDIYGEGSPMLAAFYKVVQEQIPGAWALNEAMLGTWQPDALSHDWVLPDNYHVHIKTVKTCKTKVNFLNTQREVFFRVNAPVEGGRGNGAHMAHSIDGLFVREIGHRAAHAHDNPITQALNKLVTKLENQKVRPGSRMKEKDDEMVEILWTHYLKSGFLSSRILGHLKVENIGLIGSEGVPVIREMLDSLPKKSFQMISNHDCFRVHPNYGNSLRRQYNWMLMCVARSRLLEYIVSQMTGQTMQDVASGRYTDNIVEFSQEILNSNYALS